MLHQYHLCWLLLVFHSFFFAQSLPEFLEYPRQLGHNKHSASTRLNSGLIMNQGHIDVYGINRLSLKWGRKM